MDLLIDENIKMLNHLKESKELLDNNRITDVITHKIKIIYENMSYINDSLSILNTNIKLKNNIELNEQEKDYLKNEEKSNKILTKIMPALIFASMDTIDSVDDQSV